MLSLGKRIIFDQPPVKSTKKSFNNVLFNTVYDPNIFAYAFSNRLIQYGAFGKSDFDNENSPR